ncbi:MAG: hypothetical protein JKY96_05830 [Phycisphaerales bacterium]|nr:hypothetical protein [Phycisphaerales bacterium]
MSPKVQNLLPIDIAQAQRAIEDPAATAFVVRSVLSGDDLKRYTSEVENQFASAPVGKVKPTVDTGEDFVLPWIFDQARKEHTVHRLYRFCNNDPATHHGEIHTRIMNTRDAIEQAWDNADAYRQHHYRNIHIITRYLHNAEGYPRHNDVPYEHPFPMLQCWMQLTEPGVDFGGGDLILHPPEGPSISAFEDLKIGAGDLIFFDKRTEHEVTECKAVAGGRGRIIALIGAMAPLKRGE